MSGSLSAFLGIGVLFLLVRLISRLVFRPLTAHWFAVGLYSSLILGVILLSVVIEIEPVKSMALTTTSFIDHSLLIWLCSLIPLNLLVLPGIYWWDKQLAKNNENEHAKRIPENALHALSFIGGLLGAYIGQKLFHHKSSKHSFRIKHYLLSSFSILIYAGIIYQALV